MARENRKRDKSPVLEGEGTEKGFADKTDKFRYKLWTCKSVGSLSWKVFFGPKEFLECKEVTTLKGAIDI